MAITFRIVARPDPNAVLYRMIEHASAAGNAVKIDLNAESARNVVGRVREWAKRHKHRVHIEANGRKSLLAWIVT